MLAKYIINIVDQENNINENVSFEVLSEWVLQEGLKLYRDTKAIVERWRSDPTIHTVVSAAICSRPGIVKIYNPEDKHDTLFGFTIVLPSWELYVKHIPNGSNTHQLTKVGEDQLMLMPKDSETVLALGYAEIVEVVKALRDPDITVTNTRDSIVGEIWDLSFVAEECGLVESDNTGLLVYDPISEIIYSTTRDMGEIVAEMQGKEYEDPEVEI